MAGWYEGDAREWDAFVLCGTIQNVSRNLEAFDPREFGYLAIDECHHGTAKTYQKVMPYFYPEFTLGLTVTPERSDREEPAVGVPGNSNTNAGVFWKGSTRLPECYDGTYQYLKIIGLEGILKDQESL